MSRRTPIFVFALVAISTVAYSVPADACGGQSRSIGGFSGGHIGYSVRGYSRPAYSQPSYSQPVQRHSTYAQPTYHQSSFTQPIQSRIVHTSPARTSQVVTSVPGSTSQFATSSVTSASQRPVGQQSQSSFQQQSQQPQSNFQQQPQANAGSGSGNLEQSALQMLAGNNSAPATQQASTGASIPQFQTQTNPNAGTWVATLPGNSSVTLDLNNDGTFKWTANSKGQQSSFDGNFAIENGSLTLLRSSDSGKLAGSMTANGSSAFQFKVAGADNGLDFKRR